MKITIVSKSLFYNLLKSPTIIAQLLYCINNESKTNEDEIGILLDLSCKEKNHPFPLLLNQLLQELDRNVNKKVVGIVSTKIEESNPLGFWNWKYPSSNFPLQVILPHDGNEIWNYLATIDVNATSRMSKL